MCYKCYYSNFPIINLLNKVHFTGFLCAINIKYIVCFFKTKGFLVIWIQIYDMSRYKSGTLRNQQNYKYSINTINYKYQFYIYYFIFLEFDAIKLWSISPYLIITQGFLYNLLQSYVKIAFDLSNYEDILVCISKIWRNSSQQCQQSEISFFSESAILYIVIYIVSYIV